MRPQRSYCHSRSLEKPTRVGWTLRAVSSPARTIASRVEGYPPSHSWGVSQAHACAVRATDTRVRRERPEEMANNRTQGEAQVFSRERTAPASVQATERPERGLENDLTSLLTTWKTT